MIETAAPALVGIVPRENLWPVIQKQRWYHIPAVSAPKTLPRIKYLSFYFPAAFGKDLKYKVIYYAPVRHIEVVKRIELFPDENKHPKRNKDYFQIHIDRIECLPRPIPSRRWRRIVHIPTNLGKLLTAKEINDLYQTSPLEDKVYKVMKTREIFPERQFFVYLDKQVYCLDFCVFCRKANIDVECDGERYHALPDAFTRDRLRNNRLGSYGWHVLRFSGKEINRDVKNCVSVVERTIKSLHGLS